MATFFSILARLFGNDGSDSIEVKPIYREMRNLVLNLTEKEAPYLAGKPVLGVLMETGFSDNAYTLAATGDGGASLYFSNGGGLIGAGEHAEVRPESLKLIHLAFTTLKHMKKTDRFPIVQPGNTTFYMVTNAGVLTYTAKEDDLGEGRDKRFSELFHQAHALITQMRIVDEKLQTKQRDADTDASP